MLSNWMVKRPVSEHLQRKIIGVISINENSGFTMSMW